MSLKPELFEVVRAAVSGRLQDESQLRDLSMRVAEESTALRRRIERAVQYARKGLRLEACAEAEAEPSVFDLARAFDTDEMRQWRAFCKRERLAVPEEVPSDSIGEIEEAIERTAPLRNRLALIRRLVLSDASAWLRLDALRQLASRDPDNPAWQDDIAALEPVAANELAERADEDLRCGRLEDAEEGVLNLEDGRWRWSGSAKVAADLRRRIDAAFAGRILAEAEGAVLRLESERAAENEAGSRSERASLEPIVVRLSERGGKLPAALSERIAAVDRWLNERDSDASARLENRERVEQLERLCGSGAATLAQLRTALRLAEETLEGVPDDVRAAAERRIEALERSRRLRRGLVVAGIVVFVLAAGAGAFLAIRWNQREQRIESLVAAVRASVDAGRLDDAERELAGADGEPAVLADGRVASARSRLEEARAAVAARARAFAAMMSEAGDPESPAARPQRIEEAKKLASTQSEQDAIAGWVDRHRAALARRRDERVRAGTEEVRALRARVAAAQPSADPSWEGRLSQWESELGNVRRNFGDLEEVLGAVAEARALVDSQRAKVVAMRRDLDREAMLDGLGAAARTPDELVGLIDRFLAQHPGTPEAAELSRAKAGRAGWDAVLSFAGVVPKPTASLARAPQADRSAVSAAVEKYLEVHPGSPLEPQCSALIPLLRPAPSWRDAWLSVKLSEEGYGFGYWCVELTDGSRRYCRKDPRLTAWAPQAGSESKVLNVLQSCKDRREELELIDSRTVRKPSGEGESPQMVLAGRLRSLVRDEDGTSNDVALALDALAAIRASETVDGAVAAGLAGGIIESLLRDEPAAISRQLRDAARRLARERPEDVDWINPKDRAARERSRAIGEVMREVVQPERWRKDYEAALAAACAPFAQRYLPAGVLRKVDGKVRFLPVAEGVPGPGTELLAVEPGTGDARAMIVPVGTARPGGGELLPSAMSFPSGTMVFFVDRSGGP